MIVITTPTGDIGHRVLAHVLEGSEPVRVIARNPSRIPQTTRERIEIIEGSHGDPKVIEKALTGADSLFWLVPPDTTLDSVDEAYVGFTRPAADAIRRTGVQRVVVISAIGSGWPKEAGLVTSSVKADALLASTGVALRVLAMPSFMDNLLGQAQTIREKGMFFSPIHADLKAPTVATSDIAAVAADLLLDSMWSGQAEVPVLGPEDISPNEMAAILTDVLGRPIRFQQTSIDAFKSRMASFGMSEAFAQGYADMMKAKNEGLNKTASRAVAAHTPTTFRQWCETVLKPAVLG
jgi:uncharacterized protein YbjT (DUF2867 family)